MQKNKFAFCLILVILFLCSSLLALAGNTPLHSRRNKIEHNPPQIENSLMLQKESRAPLTPDQWLSHLTQKISEPAAGTGAIRGRVTQAPGGTTPIENVYIYADQLDCPYYTGSAISDPDGYYVIESLPEGIYFVSTENDSFFVDLYWNNQPIGGEPDTVSVVSNDTTPNIDFSLQVGGKITGRVTMPGAFLTSVTVYAKDTLSLEEYSGYADILLDSASYEIRKLPSGFYKVNTANGDSFVDEYYNDKPNWASANPVSVTEGSTTFGINFTLALGGKITGTLTLPGASSVMAFVDAINTSTGDSYSGYAINPSGNSANYEITGLPTGTYKVNTFNLQGYLDEYYNDKPDETSADPVSVTLGGITPNINFTLTLGGIIKGTVTSSAKGPLKDISVYAYSLSYTSLWGYSYGSSDSSGNYRLGGLRSGWWRILARGDTTYAFEYYNNDSSWITADSVLVTVSDSVSSKDFSLEVGGSISGYVYGEGGLPLSGVYVTAYSYPETPLGFLTKVDATSGDGSYKIGGLRTGWYKVGTYYCGSMYYNNKSSLTEADSVHVTMPAEVTGVNFNFPSAVGDDGNQPGIKPNEFDLSQNYPNPFNPTTIIEYTLQKKTQVNLEIYNLLGQKVKTLVNEYQSPGSYRIFWDGKNEQDKTVATGIYFYKFEANGVSQTKKMIMLK